MIDADLDSFFSIRIPTTNVLIYLAGKRLGLSKPRISELLSRHSSYCLFVHPYPQTMQYSPFTSIDEVDLWMRELKATLCLLNELLCRLTIFFRSGLNENCYDKQSSICGNCRFMENRLEYLSSNIVKKKRWRRPN
jgi:hypothetical protein